MQSIVLNVSGMKFTTAFNTVVVKVINPDKDSSIVLDSMRNVEIPLGEKSATELGIVQNSQVTIKPEGDGTSGSFTLEVGQVVKPASSSREAPSRGSGAAHPMVLSNDW